MSGDVVNYRDTTTSLNKRKIANQVLKRPANYTSCVNAAPACWAPAQYHWQLSVILYRLASTRINTFPGPSDSSRKLAFGCLCHRSSSKQALSKAEQLLGLFQFNGERVTGTLCQCCPGPGPPMGAHMQLEPSHNTYPTTIFCECELSLKQMCQGDRDVNKNFNVSSSVTLCPARAPGSRRPCTGHWHHHTTYPIR